MTEFNKYQKSSRPLYHINRNKLMAGVLFLITAVFLIACSSESIKNGRYYNKKHKFSIQFPEMWEKQKSEPGVVVTFGAPENTTKVGIQRLKLPSRGNFQQVIKFMRAYITNIGGSIIDEGNELIDSTNSTWFLAEFTGKGEMMLAYYFEKNNYIYSILCSADTQDFYEDEMRTIAQSFRFEE